MGLNDTEEQAVPDVAVAVDDAPNFVLSDVDVDLAQVRVIESYLDQVAQDASVYYSVNLTAASRFATLDLAATQYGNDSYVVVSPLDGLPPKARLCAECDFSAPSSAPTVPLNLSAHTSRVGVFKRAQKKTQKAIIFKLVQDGRLAQLEAWFCACHQLLTPECVPKARVVYYQGQAVGIYSEMLNDFRAIGDEKITHDLLARHAANLARIMICAYLLEEDDLHRFNFSLKHRIDFDGSFWSLMSNYKGKRFWTSPESAFGVDMEDIRHFPNIGRCDPFYWPTKHHLFKLRNDFTAEECACFVKLLGVF